MPLIPGYIAFVSGISVDEMTSRGTSGRKMASAMLSSVMFVLGFSFVFVVLGASATWLGAFLVQRLPLLTSIAGAVIIFFGLQQIGLLKLGLLLSTKQVDLPAEKLGLFKAPILGAAFAFGWTPCVGPILAAILTYAATMETVGKGVMLLTVYSAGLGIPFLLTTLAMSGAQLIPSSLPEVIEFLEVSRLGLLQNFKGHAINDIFHLVSIRKHVWC